MATTIEDLNRRCQALEDALKKTTAELNQEKASRQIDVKKVGDAFQIIHSPDAVKWKEAGLRLQGEHFTEQIDLDHLWAVGTPEECFKIISE